MCCWCHRMRASVRKTRDKLASHSHGVRHSVVERKRLATLVLLSETEPGKISNEMILIHSNDHVTGDGQDVSAAERARLSILRMFIATI